MRGRGGRRGRGGERGGFRGRGPSEFAAHGPSEDQTITTIVVEQIPQEKFNEADIREFFSQFGKIADITLHNYNYRNVALVKYETHGEAKAAWSSPKVIFENRFVKVYWQKSKEKTEKDGENKESDNKASAFDREEFEKQQQEAQKVHEEKARKRKDTEAAKQVLDQQREELQKRQQEEKTKLLQKLGMQVDGPDSEMNGSGKNGRADEGNASEQTKQLRAQLAALEEEAKDLGLDTANADAALSHPGRGRGRGIFRGRGRGYASRGRGFDPFYRGGYRGRGAVPRGRGGSVLRLDNRPKRVAVSGVLLNSEQDEALRQYLTVSLPVLLLGLSLTEISRVLASMRQLNLIPNNRIP